MRTLTHQDVVDHSVRVITLARPLVEAITRRDRELGSQLHRALSSIALNIAEGFGTEAGNARLRFQTARGSLYEARAGLLVATAWGYVSEEHAQQVLAEMNALGGRVYGLSRRYSSQIDASRRKEFSASSTSQRPMQRASPAVPPQ